MTRIVFNREEPKPSSKEEKRKKRLTSYQRKLLREDQSSWKEKQSGTCPVCCINRAIELHHIIPKGMGGNPKGECPENWIYICRSCHNGFHSGRIPLAAIMRAKRATDGLDVEKLRELGGHRLIPDLVDGDRQDSGDQVK